MLATRKLFGISDPLIVRSPGLAELGGAEAAEVVSVHQPRGGVVQLDEPQVPVGVKQARAALGMMPDLAQTILAADFQFIFSRLIGEVCNRFAVGRPRRIAISRCGAVGQIADIAFVGGHSEYLSPGLEDRARARG